MHPSFPPDAFAKSSQTILESKVNLSTNHVDISNELLAHSLVRNLGGANVHKERERVIMMKTIVLEIKFPDDLAGYIGAFVVQQRNAVCESVQSYGWREFTIVGNAGFDNEWVAFVDIRGPLSYYDELRPKPSNPRLQYIETCR